MSTTVDVRLTIPGFSTASCAAAGIIGGAEETADEVGEAVAVFAAELGELWAEDDEPTAAAEGEVIAAA
jgi:hypothetical protein